MKKLIPQKIKNYYHLAQAILANIVYGFPSKRIKIIGVTGTDGKTTTSQMISKILEEAGHKVAMATTINFKLGGEEWKNLSHFTTMSSFSVQKFIKRAADNGCEYLILETSSHSLDQNRVWGVKYRTAVITNVTREHLDYHKTMDEYRKAKLKLFERAEVAIVNMDMEDFEQYLQYDNMRKIRYGLEDENADVAAHNISLHENNTDFEIDDVKFKLDLPGNFNVENTLAAVCVGMSENVSLEKCASALKKIQGIPGRLESVPNDKGVNIIVDFALTPDAVEKLYQFINGTKEVGAKLIAVFGACGERDRGKRPILGKIASRYADKIVITNDEPYSENPNRIIREIASGIENKKKDENFWIIPDRRQAIRKALEMAVPGDVVAVTGMGAEESMIMNGHKIPWNDKKVIQEELSKLK